MLALMAIGFGVGSILFAVGAVMAWFPGHEKSSNLSFVWGAMFFTAAAVVQWRAAVMHHPNVRTVRRRAELALQNPDWTAAVVQLLGTLEFNVMTIRALLLTAAASESTPEQVWRPDVFGSLLFLAASSLAWQPIARLRRHRLLGWRSRVICASNLLGSVFFAISAVSAMSIANGQILSPWWANTGTLLGAIGFLVGAVLLWPPRQIGSAAAK